MTFFWTCFQAAPNSLMRSASVVAQLGGRVLLRLGLERVELGLALGLVGHDRLGEPVLREARDDVVEVVAEERTRLPRPARLTPAASMNACWKSICSSIARLAASRPSATISSVGARRAAGREQLPGVVGRLALDHQDVDLAGVVAAAGHDHVERGLLDLLERRVR